MLRLALIALIALVLAAVPASAAAPSLRLPYDVEVDRGGRIFLADGGRHQILRWDARRRSLVVVAGTGRAGSTGDGGRATRARIGEPTCLALDRSGNLYFSDVANGVVRRVDPRGTISTVARIEAAAGVSVDPAGRHLAVASIERGVLRVELASGLVETLAPAGRDGVETPHGVAYGANGDLWIGDTGGGVLRLRPGGRPEQVSSLPAFRVVPLADGGAYLVTGRPSGGRVLRLRADGRVTRVAGTGGLGRHADGGRALRAGILPSDVAPRAGGALLLAQTRPVPAVRVVDRRGIIRTLIR